jgi:hypothetical protein
MLHSLAQPASFARCVWPQSDLNVGIIQKATPAAAWFALPTSSKPYVAPFDLVTLGHIKEQSHLSLGSFGRSGMTEELKEIG